MTCIVKPPVHDVPYHTLSAYYTQCLKEHGPTARGVDWPTEEGALTRHGVMATLWAKDHFPDISILDLGCGYGGFLTYLKSNDREKNSTPPPSSYALIPSLRLNEMDGFEGEAKQAYIKYRRKSQVQKKPRKSRLDQLKMRFGISYTGIDLSPHMITTAQQLNPNHDFRAHDIIQVPLAPHSFDYGVMNGVLTEKRELSFETMCIIAETLIYSLFKTCRKGIAFNVMNHHVDFKRPDLFYLPLDRLAAFLTEKCSRHITIRADYGLYEYTVYVYHHTPSVENSYSPERTVNK